MPLARYFLVVGGVLFALLFIVSALAPILPVAESNNGKHSTIRIQSELKLPERVVYDTSLPMIVPVHTATGTRSRHRRQRCPMPRTRPAQRLRNCSRPTPSSRGRRRPKSGR